MPVCRTVIVVILVFFLTAACSQSEQKTPTDNRLDQAALNELANQLQLQYRLVDNQPAQGCDPKQTDGQCFLAVLELKSPIDWPHRNWQLYLSHVAYIQQATSEAFSLTHINGDLYRLQPKPSWRGFDANQSYSINLYAHNWSLHESDVMPNLYLHAPGLQPAVIKASVDQWQEHNADKRPAHLLPYAETGVDLHRSAADVTPLATPAWLAEQYQWQTPKPEAIATRIIPAVAKQQMLAGEALDLSRGFAIDESDLRARFPAIAEEMQQQQWLRENGIPLQITVPKDKKTSQPQESYRLSLNAARVVIESPSETGAFYALQTLLALAASDQPVPPQIIDDAPHFGFRGLHIDVARNFQSKQEIQSLIRQMARYKLNKLHLHLADDEGWRLEIPALPELTDVGAFRCHDLNEQQCLLPQLGSGPHRDSPINGFLSAKDYQDLLKFAEQHHIEIIPALDMPGHARAAIVAMKVREQRLQAAGKADAALTHRLHDPEDKTEYLSIQYYRDNTINPCIDTSYQFVATILDEVKRLHNEAGVPLITFHVGADETPGAWGQSPACSAQRKEGESEHDFHHRLNAQFLSKVQVMLTERDITMAGWSDGMATLLSAKVDAPMQVNAWGGLAGDGHKLAHQFANAGHRVVLSFPDVLYFDFPYVAAPEEPGYYWGARRVDLRKVFSFMPDNLPAHAEIWRDRNEQPFAIDERREQGGEPLNAGVRFAGIQGQLWSETVRTPERLHYMIYPRLLALAERAWHKPDWALPYDHNGRRYGANSAHFNDELKQRLEQDWQAFVHRFADIEWQRLEQDGVQYRIPPVGARRIGEQLELVPGYPGWPVFFRYSAQDTWQRYETAIKAQAGMEFRGSNPSQTRFGRINRLENEARR
ncbi:family 20 glycosylhydrolase [Permianibacter aggregans]|uniref:beta-N-acetylhexosaminidase n=1 Tax=Permianibacter aggregans TaxID=1510150 RepID=A0A4R6UQE5_9GAMM|nr:family 20 glycosylhydrolase [Permianibacter aggregans]TDQ47475.1 hexosaminidase [Permianibacter aggregans]